MNKRESGIALAFVLGVVLLLSASPATALFCALCTCAYSCDQACITGPEIPDCPECNDSTCGLDGPLCAGNPECELDGCWAVSCTSTINGTSSGDTLNGGSGHECINGLGGDDTITGNAGFDCADGGAGADNCNAEYEINCGP